MPAHAPEEGGRTLALSDAVPVVHGDEVEDPRFADRLDVEVAVLLQRLDPVGQALLRRREPVVDAALGLRRALAGDLGVAHAVGRLHDSVVLYDAPPMPINAARFWGRVDVSGGPDACWPWLGPVIANGYGVHTLRKAEGRGAAVYVHRLAYELAHGEIAGGLVVDHECHNRAAEQGACQGGPCLHRRCANPAHLRVVPQGRNMAASPLTVTGKQVRRTHCPRGHPLSGPNLYTYGSHRQCRACRANYQKTYERKDRR